MNTALNTPCVGTARCQFGPNLGRLGGQFWVQIWADLGPKLDQIWVRIRADLGPDSGSGFGSHFGVGFEPEMLEFLRFCNDLRRILLHNFCKVLQNFGPPGGGDLCFIQPGGSGVVFLSSSREITLIGEISARENNGK